ncbi:hypothetical protein QTP86_011754 [Hemibagrus guttatus]|nr:hypothetical protein QTP86_011754 [Hemibagrus guttatus]
MEPSLHGVLDVAVKIVNFVKARTINFWLFTALGKRHKNLSYNILKLSRREGTNIITCGDGGPTLDLARWSSARSSCIYSSKIKKGLCQ